MGTQKQAPNAMSFYLRRVRGFEVSSMAFAAIAGIVLNLIMPGRENEESGETAFIAAEPEAAAAE